MNRTDFIAATECSAKGWHQGHNPPALDAAAEFAMEQHRELKDLARNIYPNGTLVSGGGRIDTTQLLVADPNTNTVYEAAFRAGVLTATVDILSRDGNGWTVIAVKSSFSDKKKLDDYVDALAYPAMVLRRAGVPVSRSTLLLLSRDYRRGDPAAQLFVPVDKTGEVDERAQVFEQQADALAAAVLADDPPPPTLNPACWGCDFFESSCLGHGRGHTVVELPKLHATRKTALCTQGVIDIADIPDDLKRNPVQQRAKGAMESGEITVEAEGLAAELAALEWPCHYLDFETVNTTLPLYDGYACHAQVVTQFSVHHRGTPDAEPSHSEFLARAEESQERTLAEYLIQVLGGRGAIIVYGNFEQQRINDLAARLPDLAQPLTETLDRLVDFEKIIKEHVYHPAFGGSFSLKKVVPALVPDVNYDDLEVSNGTAAIRLFARMARRQVEDIEGARRDLLAYCKTDTFVMVRLHEVLARMA